MYSKIISIVSFLLLCCSTIYGQQTKTITGKVIDGNSYPLFGATAILQDASGNILSGVVTNEFGEFIIRTNQTTGKTVKITYIGYANQTLDIDLSQNDLDLGTVQMQITASELDEVVVSGSMEGKTRALNQQRTADNIKNVVSADLIGRNPDLNIAEALQRVSGVNIQRDKGEGSMISIRGTPVHYTTIQINGQQIPSAQSDGSRAESLDLIPVDQLASMEITKVATPDMDGDAIGGTVNLKTPTARRFDLGVKAESGLGYNDISNGLNGIGKLRLDKRFFKTDNNPEGKLGVMLGGSMYNSDNSEHRVDGDWTAIPELIIQTQEEEFVLDQYDYRLTENNRERIGATATLDYKFNDNHNIVFNYVYSQRQDIDVRHRSRFDVLTSGAEYQTLDSITSARVRRDINFTDELKINQVFSLQGEHILNNWEIAWQGFYSATERTETSDLGRFQSNDDVTIIADNPLGIFGRNPNFRVSVNEEQSVYDPLLYSSFERYIEDLETIDATNLVGKLDVTKHFELGEHQSLIKFGGKYRTQTNDKFRDNTSSVFNDPNNLINEEEAFLRSLSGTEPASFLYGNYRFGPLLGEDEFKEYVNTNSRFLNQSDRAWAARRSSLNDTYKASEDIYAGYFMAKVQFDKLMVLAGLRYEFNEVRYDAFDVFRFGTNVIASPIQGGNEYGFLLPNIHLKYNLNDYTALRFSTVFNYARPNFVDLVPFVDLDFDSFGLTLGNPNLRAAEALNIDLMFEHYFKDVGVISFGAFYKDIDLFQFSRIDPALQQDFPGYPNTQGFEFRQEQNGENAIVAGIEFNFLRSLSFLPGLFKNFNLEGNYTYAYSDAFTEDRDNISLPGQAEHTFNAGLGFDYKGFTARVSANYNGSFLVSIASSQLNDIIQADRIQFDANASLKFLKNWRIYIEGVNLSNEPTIRYQGDESRIARIAYFGWAIRTGISYSL